MDEGILPDTRSTSLLPKIVLINREVLIY